jgi:hypothetical protein
MGQKARTRAIAEFSVEAEADRIADMKAWLLVRRNRAGPGTGSGGIKEVTRSGRRPRSRGPP